MNPLNRLVSVPVEVVNAVAGVNGLSGLLREMAASTSVLPEMLRNISRVAKDTAALPGLSADMARVAEGIKEVSRDTSALDALRTDMARVADNMAEVASSTAPLSGMAEATGVLPGMDDRMATIEGSMPVLVEVQQHLARLPETMDALSHGLNELSALMQQLVGSLERLDRNVDSLADSVEPLGRLAERLPGGGRR